MIRKLFTFRNILIALTVIVVLYFAGKATVFKGNTSQNSYDPKKDTVVTPVKQDISETLTLSGSVDATSKSTATFPTSGTLAWVGVKVGDRVKRYQSLASLDKVQLQKQLQTDFNAYQTTLSQFNDTQDQYRHLKETYQLTDADKRILDRAQWNLENSVVQYELQDIAIRNATIFTPISGVVVDVSQPNPGVNVTPLNATYTVIDPNTVYLKTKIDQDAVMNVKVGDKAIVTLDSYPDQKFDSQVTYVSFTPVQGETSTVYEVRFALPGNNDDLKYRLGMDGDANIIVASAQNVLTVPLDAVSEDTNGQKYVYVKNGNNLERKDIKTGVENDNNVEVTQGLTENDQVVIKQK